MRYSFFLHYNKPASQKAGRVQISIHYRGRCIIADSVDCQVPTGSRIRNTSPKFVMAGKAKEISVKEGVATIS